MRNFKIKRLIGGPIVVIFSFNRLTGYFHGYNPASPTLKVKNFKSTKFDHSWSFNVTELLQSVKPNNFYSLNTENKKRYQYLEKLLY